MKKYFVFFAFALLLVGSVSALDWPFNKFQTCTAFNVTGAQCETFWCQSIQEGNYSATKEICEFNVVQIVNQTINQTVYLTNGTNETQGNFTLNTTDFYTKTETDGMFRAQRDSFANTTDKLEDRFFNFQGNQNTSTGGGLDTITVVLIILGLVVVLGGYMWVSGKKPQQTPYYQGAGGVPARPVPRMMKSPRELELEDEIDKWKKAVSKEEKEKHEKHPISPEEED